MCYHDYIATGQNVSILLLYSALTLTVPKTHAITNNINFVYFFFIRRCGFVFMSNSIQICACDVCAANVNDLHVGLSVQLSVVFQFTITVSRLINLNILFNIRSVFTFCLLKKKLLFFLFISYMHFILHLVSRSRLICICGLFMGMRLCRSAYTVPELLVFLFIVVWRVFDEHWWISPCKRKHSYSLTHTWI